MKTTLSDQDLRITGNYGDSYPQYGVKFHKGIDFGGIFSIKSPVNGKVVFSGWDPSGFGNLIVVFDGQVYHYFGHLSTLGIGANDSVSKGQYIGVSGDTGNSFGAHLHYEVRTARNPNTHVNPAKYITITNSTSTMKTVTVQSGWGLSNVAKAAGLPMVVSTYEDIYDLNKGHRGSTDWRSLNTRMGPGDTLKVPNAAPTPLPVPQPTPSDNSALQKEYDDLKKQIKDLSEKNAQIIANKNKEIGDNKNKIEELTKEINESRDEISALLEERENYNLEKVNLPPEIASLGNVNISGIITDFIEESGEVNGILNKWSIFVDKHFSSNILKSILKYDMFVVVGSLLPQVPIFLIDYNLPGYILALISIGSGIVIKLLTTRYDSNKDGLLSINDTIILRDYTVET